MLAFVASLPSTDSFAILNSTSHVCKFKEAKMFSFLPLEFSVVVGLGRRAKVDFAGHLLGRGSCR